MPENMSEDPLDTALDSADTDSADAGAESGSPDLLSGLSDLLEAEGESLEETEDSSTEALTEELLFAELEDQAEEEPAESAPAAEIPTTPRKTARRPARGGRARQNRAADEFRAVEAGLQTTPLGLQIAEDHMTAQAKLLTAQNTYEEIIALLEREGIVHGIQHEDIRASVGRAQNGSNQDNVLLAQGTAPVVRTKPRIAYRLPPELRQTPKDGDISYFERLKQAIESPRLDAIKAWNGPVAIVHPGEAVAELVQAEYDPGIDVFGNEVHPDFSDEIQLQAGENTSVDDSDERVVADVYGYAGLLGEVPSVVPPLWVSADNMEARFVHIAPPEPVKGPTPADIEELLSLKWIENGVLHKQIKLLQKRLKQQQSVAVALPLAQGKEAVPGVNAQLVYAFDSYEIIKWNQLQTILSNKTAEGVESGFTEFFSGEEADPDSPISFKAFASGEAIAEKIPATEGEAGIDIQGTEVEAHPGEDTELEVGENLAFSEDGLQATAEIFGYICLQYDIQPMLFSPLWIPAESDAVYYLDLPQDNKRYPSYEDLCLLLEQAHLPRIIDEAGWTELSEGMAGGKTSTYLVPLAQAEEAQPGEDSRFEWAVDMATHLPGRVLEDGTIDFRDRNLQTVVQGDQLIGRLYPPQPGTPGRDIFGETVEPPPPKAIEIITDTRIYAEAEDGCMAFFAEVEGGLSSESDVHESSKGTTERIHLGIYPISNIEGDVDYNTGNIDFNGDVVIKGSVQSQFSVKATGSIAVGGFVESGAYLAAGKDVMIKNGILGSSTEIVAGGDFMCKFVQEATVRAQGDIRIGSYGFNASLRAAGVLVVTGRGDGNARALVGGFAWGARGVQARSIGSPYNSGTRLVAGVDPAHLERLEQLRANLHSCQEKQKQLADTIGVDRLDINLIKIKLARTENEAEKQSILAAVKRMARVTELAQSLQKEIDGIGEAQQELAARARIEVPNELFAGVELRLGEYTHYVQEDTSGATFKLVTEDDETKIQLDRR